MTGRSEGLVYTLYQQGCRRLAAGRARAAAEILELAVEQEPAQASLQEALGRAYFASARPERARQALQRALELDPSDAYAHYLVGRCHERQGRLPAAAKHFKLAAALSGRAAYTAARDRVVLRLDSA